MNYTKDEAVSEILKRSRKIKRKREKLKIYLLLTGILLTSLATIGTGYLSAGSGGHEAGLTSYGSFLMPGSAGGYVLAAVVSFVVGVVVAILIFKQRSKDRFQEKNRDKEDTGEES